MRLLFRTFLVALLLSSFIPSAFSTKLVELKIIDQDYIVLHFQDGDALYVDDGVGPGSLREYNYDDPSNNFTVTYGNPLNIGNAIAAGNWIIKSSGDPNYSGNGQAVSSVSRKSKIGDTEEVEFVPGVGWTYEYSTEHFIILQLPNSMVSGQTYTLEINGSTESDTEIVSFDFDQLTTRSEAVHVNVVGYANTNTIKAADLYMWLGNGGSRDYSSFVGNKVYLVDVATEVATEVGNVSFGQNNAVEYTGFDFTQSPVWHADFTGFNTPGTYRLAIEGVGCSDEFEIRQDIYFQPYKVSTQGFYYMRIGEDVNANAANNVSKPRQPKLTAGDPSGFKVILTELNPFDPQWADQWDNPSAFVPFIKAGSPENTAVLKGHSDARDWDRNLNHVTIIWDMLLPYILTDGALSDDDLGIAESGNGDPDILDEARNEVDFWLALRDGPAYSWGLSNPTTIFANGIIYQAGTNSFAAWANAVNCAIMAQAYRIHGDAALETYYTNEAITAYNFANTSADPMLNNVWN
ncbi:MAG: glycosyl hydrolase family 5, partial [Bacteroidota bacterium]